MAPFSFEPTINVTALSGVIVAVILAVEGYRQRKENRGKPLNVTCPPAVATKLEQTAAEAANTGRLLEEVLDRLEAISGTWDEETKAWIRFLRDSHSATDANGVLRWYSRDQGVAILAAIEDLRRSSEAGAHAKEGAIRDLAGKIETLTALLRRGDR